MIVWLRGECAPLERTMAGSERGPRSISRRDQRREARSCLTRQCALNPPVGLARRPSGRLTKGQGGGISALEPGLAPACSEGRQRIGCADGCLEPATELPHCLDPGVANDPQSLQNWRKLGWDRPLTRRPKLSTGPIEK